MITVKNKKESIIIKTGQTFTIILESNPTTGFRWIPVFDKSFISLISHDFCPSSTKGIGQYGKEIFTFLGLNSGSDILKMQYKRTWEKRSVAEKIFVINIK